MPAANAYAAKRACRDLFAAACAAAAPGNALSGVDVAYANHQGLGDKAVYGGGFSFEHEDLVGERGVLIGEVTSLTWIVRVVMRPRCDVEEADVVVEAIINALAVVLKANPTLAGAIQWLDMPRGTGDYQMPNTEDETVSLASFTLRFGSNVVWGA